VSNGANIRRHKSAERLEYKGTRKNICCTEERRPAIGLYHVSSQKAHVQILTPRGLGLNRPAVLLNNY